MGGMWWLVCISWRNEARPVLKGGNPICLHNHPTMLSRHQPLNTCSTLGDSAFSIENVCAARCSLVQLQHTM